MDCKSGQATFSILIHSPFTFVQENHLEYYIHGDDFSDFSVNSETLAYFFHRRDQFYAADLRSAAMANNYLQYVISMAEIHNLNTPEKPCYSQPNYDEYFLTVSNVLY